MSELERHWPEIIDTIRASGARFVSLLQQCKLGAHPDGTYSISTPNKGIYGALLLYREQIEATAQEVLKVDGQVTLSPPENRKTNRPLLVNPPPADDQLRLFVPEINEIPLKDDVHLMSIAVWTSSPAIDRDPERMRTQIHYEANGMAIQIKASPETGLPTHLDYDVVILMQSWLVQETNKYREQLRSYEKLKKLGKQADKPAPPPRRFPVHKKDILAFARREKGGKQYERIEETLNRLMNTKIHIVQAGTRRRRKGVFSLISDWATVSKTDSGEVMAVEIEIPGWIYEGIVETEKPSVLTYSRDYFLLKKPNARLLYRLGKLHAKMGEVVFDLSEIHHRSGSRAALKEFNRELVQMLRTFDMSQFPDYDLELNDEKRNRTLRISAKSKKA